MTIIRNAKLGYLILLLTILPWAVEAKADDSESGDWSEIGVEGDSSSNSSNFQFQAGMFYRFAGDRFDESSEPYVVTFDFNFLFDWDRRGSTWGAGLHLAFDGDGGPRFGPKVLWRTSLRRDKPEFFQLGACLYVASRNDKITAIGPMGQALYGGLVMPGFCFEAELGLTDWFSIAGAMEILKVEYGTGNYSGSGGDAATGKTTDTHFYIGGKAGGLVGVGLMGVAAIIAGISMANSPMSSW